MRSFSGKPLIEWSIEAALKSKYIDRLIVTSDSPEILNLATSMGVESIIRPTELASDTATSFDVIKHTIEFIDKIYKYVILLQPTSPLRNTYHIDSAVEYLLEKQADAVVGVTQADHSPLWANTLSSEFSMSNFLPNDIINARSQDLPPYYRINGAIYICKTNQLLSQGSFYLDSNIYAFIMDRSASVDIDDEIDFSLAELLHIKMHK